MSDLEQLAIQRIKAASEMSLRHYKQPLVCTYSGGKDSDVMLTLFRRAGIPFEVINSHTTADAPPTVRHIREVFHQLELDGISCRIVHPTYKGQRTSMWSLIPQKLVPPTHTQLDTAVRSSKSNRQMAGMLLQEYDGTRV